MGLDRKFFKCFSIAFQLRIDVLESFKKRFGQEGIELPYPYRSTVMKNKEPIVSSNEIELNA